MFNPHARWDRKLPAQPAYPEEKIEVLARFSGGRIDPVSFCSNRHTYAISRVNYAWEERDGADRLYYFSVSSGEDSFCIYLSIGRMSWRLKRLG